MQQFLGDPESGLLNLEVHCPALAIAKKTLDEICFRTTQKTTDREPPPFKIDQDTGLSILSVMDTTYTLKIKLQEKQDHVTSGKQRISIVPASVKAYPTCHSWIITAHVSLLNLEKQ